MTVERHSRFHTKGISGTKSAGNQSLFFSCCQKLIPHFLRLAAVQIQLYTVFSGITGLGNNTGNTVNRSIKYGMVIFLRNIFFGGQLSDNIHSLRALKGNLGIIIGYIGEFHIPELMLYHPVKVLLTVGSVYNDEVVVVSFLVND